MNATPNIGRLTAYLIATCSLALLAACPATTPTKQQSGASTSASPGAETPTNDGSQTSRNSATPVTEKAAALSKEEIIGMLIRSDPKACSASVDPSPGQTAATYAKIAALFGTHYLMSKLQGDSDARLQSTLNDFKPMLRDLSRNTLWLPMSAEKEIGRQLYKYNNFAPVGRLNAIQRKLLDEQIKPVFNELKSYAESELKSELNFELQVIQKDDARSPFVLAGGTILIPSGMLGALATARPNVATPIISFMLAHEFSHALRRHTTKSVQLSLVDSITLAQEFRQIADANMSNLSSVSNLGQMLQISTKGAESLVGQTCKAQGWFATLDQMQEFEADVCGTLLLKRLGEKNRRPVRAVDGYAQWIKMGLGTAPPKEKQGLCSVPASHPTEEDRMKNLADYSASLDRAPSPPPPATQMNRTR